MTIQLSPENEKRIQSLIDSGSFSDADEVLAKALTLLAKRQQFHEEIEESLAQLDRGERIPASEVFEEIYSKAERLRSP